MLAFIDSGYDLTTALRSSYDLNLVLLSYVVACIASYSAWDMADRLRVVRISHVRAIWLGGGAAAMGLGIWGMHFLGMLAFQLPIAVSYQLSTTVLSILPAIAASAVAIYTISLREINTLHLVTAGVFMGGGIGVMHYTGMAAMQMPAAMAYDLGLFWVSIGVAIALAILALVTKFIYQHQDNSTRRAFLKFLSVLVMGLAIVGMHYTAMAAVYFFPLPSPLVQPQPLGLVIPPTVLGAMVTIVTLLILSLATLATMFDRSLGQAVHSLNTSRRRMVQAVESISEGFILFDADDRLVMANSVFSNMHPELQPWLKRGASYTSLVEHRLGHLQDTGNAAAVDYLQRRMQWHRQPVAAFEETLSDGRQVIGREKRSGAGDLVGVWSDVSEIKRVHQELAAKEAQLRYILDMLPIPVYVRANRDSSILYMNEAAHHMNRQFNTPLSIGDTQSLVPENEMERLKARILSQQKVVQRQVTAHLQGRSVSALLSAIPVDFEHQPSILYSLIDITEQQKEKDELYRLATRDSLTGVLNRRYFRELSQQQIIRCHRNRLPLTAIMLDIDYFKQVNDCYGHDTGDRVIKKLVETCASVIREGDLFGRLGGDEFSIVMPDKTLAEGAKVAERIRASIDGVRVESARGGMVGFSVSLGLAVFEGEKMTMEELLMRADKALYEAKSKGRNQVVAE